MKLEDKLENKLIVENGILRECRLREAFIEVPEGVHTIGEAAFKGCISIEKIYLPDTVTSIGRDAFKGCRKLEEITLPSNLTVLGDYAFHRCHKLRAIHIPPSVKSLGNCVFLYCDSLETVSMAGVRRLGLQVFLNDVSLKKLVLSTELDGSEICDCFTGCYNLKEIGFSDGTCYRMENAVAAAGPESDAPALVKAIAADVCRMMEFQEGTITRFLTNIKHVDLAEGITAIGKSCFFDKRGIISVTLPKSLREIGSRAFRNCINLESLEFHGDQVAVHKDAFKNCSTLHRIITADGKAYELTGIQCEAGGTVPALVREIHSQVLGDFLISGTTLLKYRGEEARVVVPDGITEIGERAFAGNEAVDRVLLPETVRIIREEAFAGCLVLQTVTIPEKLEVMERAAFIGCVKLIRISLPDTLTKISESAFNRCRVLCEVKLGHRVEGIGPMAFYGCQKLREIKLPEGITSLENMAFYQCLTLKEVVLPSSICNLGNNVFTFSGLHKAVIACTPATCGTDVFSQCIRLEQLKFEEGVRYIGDKFAFRCEKLSVVILPSTLEGVGRHAFEGSRYLKELPAPKMAGTVFLDGSGLSGHVVLPEYVTSVAGGAFYGNDSITEITLPDSVTSIGPGAFCACDGLTSVSLPAGVTDLAERVFAYCSALKSVKVAGGSSRIRSVHASAFAGCACLTEIPDLEYCSYVGKAAFDGCEALEELGRIGSRVDTGFSPGDLCFRGTGFLKRQMEKSPLVALAGTVLHGENCRGELEILEGTLRIGAYAFYGNTSITSVTFPKSLQEIGPFAFSGCSALKRITFSNPLQSLGEAAFEACIGLNEISLEVWEIGKRAFAWCKNLAYSRCPKTKRIGEWAFCGCGELARWDGEDVREIGQGAFSGCGSLTHAPLGRAVNIGRRAFERCDSLEDITLAWTAAIEAHAFEDCGRLRTVTLKGNEGEAGELNLESYVFSGCTAIETVFSGGNGWQIKGYEALFDGKLPKYVRQIYESALSCFAIDEETVAEYCNNGRFLVIPQGIQKLGDQVFQDKSRLEEIRIPDSVGWIGARAFDKTPWLEQKRTQSGHAPVIVGHTLIDGSRCAGDVLISEDVEVVAGWAFAGNLDLTGVRLLSPKTLVEDHAFRNCVHLKRIVLPDGREYKLEGIGTEREAGPPVVSSVFADCYNCFKTDKNGILTECTGNISRLALPAGIRAVGDGAFREGNLLTVITLAPETSTIGAHAFEQCKWLEEVCCTATIETIGAMAFSGCIRLKRMGEGLSSLVMLGERAFENCTCLEEIMLPEGLEEIPRRAFYRCHQLKRITLPSTLRKIGEEAFAFCYGLPEFTLPENVAEIGHRAFAWRHGREDTL